MAVILTDLSDVLTNGMVGTEYRLAHRLFTQPGDKVDFVARFLQRREETNDQFMDLMRGRMNEDAYWHLFLASGDWPVSLEEIKAAFAENLRGKIPETLDVYRRITQHPDLPGLPQSCFIQGAPEFYLVSDHIAERVEELKANHPEVFDLVTDVYWSCELGMVKADPECFRHILDDLCVDPSETLFIDDMQVNVAMAAHTGIPSVHFRNAWQLEETLRDTYGFTFAPKSHLSPAKCEPPQPMTV